MKIAIVRLSAMGDIIHSAIALQFIKVKYPQAQIDWIVEKSMAAVLEFNPDINTIIPIELKKFKKTKKLSDLFSQIKILKNLETYDYIIDMQGLLKSAIATKFIKGESHGYDKNSIREGIASYLYKHTYTLAYDMNTIDRNVGVVSQALDLGVGSKEILSKQAFLFYKDEDPIIYDYLSKDKKNIIFVIGSTWPSRNYPKEQFVELANALKENVIVIWGSDEEKADAEFIEEHSQYAKVIPRTNLNTLKALIDKSDLLIGNDTGPTHMAWGMNKPSITIFGPTPTSRIYVTDINKLVDSPSKVDPFKLNKLDFSIKEISVSEIYKLTLELIS
ncbi:MAG TPA: lipopolysaccharide heptosyltransferase I [Sulfurimonas sp.]|nr:lipopolysaccharide heptosyltransferase I [Sulfurimonas sp.]